jgi:hypothetical protein
MAVSVETIVWNRQKEKKSRVREEFSTYNLTRGRNTETCDKNDSTSNSMENTILQTSRRMVKKRRAKRSALGIVDDDDDDDDDPLFEVHFRPIETCILF